ncbi:MAG: hypothetical protein HY076_03880 [Candidatus Eisenbacteria bacterium]|uniref:CBM-cenC domain-containing protein n=1 Tax=Eiseniibacteriota bacterium TaxID=2212470 RepID=A0A9D6L9E2_UNCEI|nr:hypothetical protein [Candidatus Eisenbacteria bacterium]MBI3539395.1 hypothetical protein [Candidatus Eisenbacteria bacterium]
MSPRIAVCAVLALGVLIACPPASRAAAAGNLLVNPDFETALSGHAWMPAGWDTSWSHLPTVFFGRDTSGAHGGRYAVSVANVSTLMPIWHNWSQTVLVASEAWGKDAVFSIWTRSNGVQGRGYVLLQAYRDTVGKMSRIWGVSRDTAMIRIGVRATSDPYVYLGMKREYFSDNETGWVRREVRVYVPPSTNILIVRGGLFGVGQVFFDDASLALEPARPAAELPVGVNLLRDPGFEGSGDEWEYSMPPYDDMRCDRDTSVAHDGKASVRFTGGTVGMVMTRAGVAQVIGNRNIGGKRVRLTGWIKTDSLRSSASIKLYATTAAGDSDVAAPSLISNTAPWTKLSLEMDVPTDSYQLWAWLLYNAPAVGKVWFDDASLEVLGPAKVQRPKPPHPVGRRLGR